MFRRVLWVLLATGLSSTAALALDAGNYTVQCGPSVAGGRETRIRMDLADMQTLRQSLGTIISGVSLADGKRVILIANDRSCSLIETNARSAGH